MRVKLCISYCGSNYSGWQVQKNAETVQGKLSEALEKFLSSETAVTGCSRTDSRVHAKEYYCHFDTEKDINPRNIVLGLNYYLPADIRVCGAEIVPPDFHARYSAKGKEYLYLVWNKPYSNPLYIDKCFNYAPKLNVERLNFFASQFTGEKDYRSFMAAGSDINDTVRRINAFEVYERDGFISFRVSGNGFLYNMVRILVGTLIELDSGKIKLSPEKIIEGRNRSLAGFTAPPEGLYLNRVFY